MVSGWHSFGYGNPLPAQKFIVFANITSYDMDCFSGNPDPNK